MPRDWRAPAGRMLSAWLLVAACLAPTLVRASIPPPPGRLIDISGHLLHLNCVGEGTPVVVLDVGLGGTALEWTDVQQRLGRLTRVCTYDRPGYGWSEPGPLPRTSEAIARELHAALVRSELPGPFVLVGHSFGGFNMRLFASLYPDATAGLVLVDASHEDQFRRMENSTGKKLAPTARFTLSRPHSLPQLPARIPEDVRALAERMHNTHLTHATVRNELAAFRTSAKQVRKAAALSPMPLVVVSRGQEDPDTASIEGRDAVREKVWSALQHELARLVPGATHLTARSDDHDIHVCEPQLVSHAIQLVIDAVRNDLRTAPGDVP